MRVTFQRTSQSPPAPAEEGIALAVIRAPGSPPSYHLLGACRVSPATAAGLEDSVLHNVAVVCTHGPDLVPVAFPLVQGEAVFADDVADVGGGRVAYFDLDLRAAGVPGLPLRHFVVASIGPLVSNAVEFEWR